VPATFATGEYYDLAGTSYYLTPAKLESDYAPVRFERELRLLRHHCPSGAVLDVGCSTGAFLYQLTTRFPGSYQATGTDVSGPALDYAESRGVPVRRGDFLNQDWADTRFDAITFWAVLEHLAQPGAFLQKAHALLRPGGWCFVLVPNFNSLATRLLGTKYRYVYPQHLNYFTTRTLHKLAGNHFEVAQVTFTHFNPVVILQDWRSGGRDVPNTERAELLKRTTGLKTKPWLKPLKWAYTGMEKTLGAAGLADNLVMVLKKPVT
jgi:2-polyprenyl-3-methyl-5-hydroxy-6-metoxy-1,4-benzoquinol methylase